jgi:hypothetical protein
MVKPLFSSSHHSDPERRLGKPKTEAERRVTHRGRYGTEELPERGAGLQRKRLLPQTKKKHTRAIGLPSRDDVTVDAWSERDRLGIWITDNRTDEIIAEWWDEDAHEMFEHGFFEPGVPRYSWEEPSRAFVDSVLDYAEHAGLLAKGKSGESMRSSSVIPLEPRRHKESELEYFADSPELLTQTIAATGYRSQLDKTFQEAIARAKGLK